MDILFLNRLIKLKRTGLFSPETGLTDRFIPMEAPLKGLIQEGVRQ
jgi:hypothetical protein